MTLPDHFSITIMMKRILLKPQALPLCLCLIMYGRPSALANLPSAGYHIVQDSLKIKGKAVDAYGKPLVDVTIQVRSRDISAATDMQGRFEIDASPGDVLVFTLSGFLPQERTITDAAALNVTLTEDPASGNSAFQVLYGTQKKTTAIQSVSEIYSGELEKTTATSFGGLLAGRLAGLFATQSSGQPGNDAVSLSLRGQAPLILVDGIPQQSLAVINPEQIASVTVLKDALSTAMLGMRGSNGAILITTKKGSAGPQRISFTALGGIQRPAKLPRFLNAYQYASLYNEALMNDGKTPFYSQADLDAYKNGTDPIGHPDVDWQKEVLRPQSAFSRFDLNISGGRKAARYFVDLDYLDQQGLFKTASFNKYNTNTDYKQYLFRSNVAVDLNKSFTANLNIFGLVKNANGPGATADAIFGNILTTPANAYPVMNPDGSLGGNQNYQDNIYGQSVRSGYQVYNTLNSKVDLSLKGKLDGLVKGLWIKGTASFMTNLIETIDRSKPLVTYQMKLGAAGDTAYQQFGSTGDQSNTGSITTRERMLYTELALGYDRHFGGHGIEAVILGNHDNMTAGNELRQNFSGLSGRVAYNFNEKYLAEAAFGYNGTDRYPSHRRYGFFPAVGVGWVLSREKFLKDKVSWLDLLKLRASYGKTGHADPGYFAYNQYYATGSSYNYSIGESVATAYGVGEDTLANPYITWEKARKFNAGIDAAFFHNKFSVTAEYFINKLYDLLQIPGNNTSILGAVYPRENLGINRVSGIELQLMYQDHAGSFHYFIAPNASFLRTKVLFEDEVYRPYPWMQRTGKPVGQPYGYIAEGLFQSQAEIDASARPAGYSPVPGDIRYKDLNGDGMIDDNDQTAIGTTRPLFYYGVYFGFDWKGFYLSALIQGVANRNLLLTGDYEWEFQQSGKGQAYAHNLGRWTPANAAQATYPRLTVGNNPNNDQNSTYWMRSGNYARLKSIEIGYTLPASVTRHVGLAAARIFLNGTNLFTAAAFTEVDPESYSGGYPIQKIMNAGLNIQF
jgi:TonB-linked SusC/RagA family outer membrane protein